MADRPRRPWGRLFATITATLAVVMTVVTLGRSRPMASFDVAQPRLPAVRAGQRRDVLLAHGWAEPAPPRLIKPSYWPFVLGLGITFLLGGIATRFLVSGVGLFIFAVGFVGWMMDLLDEQDNG